MYIIWNMNEAHRMAIVTLLLHHEMDGGAGGLGRIQQQQTRQTQPRQGFECSQPLICTSIPIRECNILLVYRMWQANQCLMMTVDIQSIHSRAKNGDFIKNNSIKMIRFKNVENQCGKMCHISCNFILLLQRCCHDARWTWRKIAASYTYERCLCCASAWCANLASRPP